MKTCPACMKEKPLSDFYVKSRGGTQTYCKVCANEKRKQWGRDNKDSVRKHRLIYRYKLSEPQFDSLLLTQSGQCKICKNEFESIEKINVDRDHSCCPGVKTCGKCVRGLLCRRCNLLVGFLEQNSHLLNSANEYLDTDKRL